MHIFVLLAAGNSMRYCAGSGASTLKQFAKVTTPNHKDTTLIECSIKAAIDAGVDKIIIVVNSRCMPLLASVLPPELAKGLSVVISDVDSREQSIRTAFNAIDALVGAGVGAGVGADVSVIIHDVARPFITADHIKAFMILPDSIKYAQYYMRIMGGLMRQPPFTKRQACQNQGYRPSLSADAEPPFTADAEPASAPPIFVNRDEYREVCTPLYIQYECAKKVLDENTSSPEFFTLLPPAITTNPQAYMFIEGEPAYLRKITYSSDLFIKSDVQ